MSTTLTIRNLDESVKQKLRMMGAAQGRSMEAQAREMLTTLVTSVKSADAIQTPSPSEQMKNACNAVRGIWKDRGTTDDMMRDLRGED
jgi:antitoxin FitA